MVVVVQQEVESKRSCTDPSLPVALSCASVLQAAVLRTSHEADRRVHDNQVQTGQPGSFLSFWGTKSVIRTLT